MSMTQKEFRKRYRYDLDKDKLGGGGFGDVFKAYDTYRDRWVEWTIVKESVMSFCSSCGQPILGGTPFCNSCGAKQGISPANGVSRQAGAPARPAKKMLSLLAQVGVGFSGLVIILGVIFVTLAVTGCKAQESKTGDADAGAATQGGTGGAGAGDIALRQMSAVDLYNEYRQNPQQALQKYRGQRIRFSGALTEKPHPAVADENKKGLGLWLLAKQNNKVIETIVYITLDTGGNTGRVIAAFKINNTVEQILRSGQYKHITFDGVVDGIKDGGQSGNFILLTDCRIVN